MSKLTPPHEVPDSLCGIPDYFCGRLIYQLDDGDACRWVVYDGDTQQRFPTRQAAEKWCLKHVYSANEADLGLLSLTVARLTSVYRTLDRLAAVMTDERVTLESIALNVRKTAEMLDNIQAKYVQNGH